MSLILSFGRLSLLTVRLDKGMPQPLSAYGWQELPALATAHLVSGWDL